MPWGRHTAMQIFRRLCAEQGYSGEYARVKAVTQAVAVIQV